MDTEVFFQAVEVTVATAAVGFTYVKFFREGRDKQRIELDIDFTDLGIVGEERMVELRTTVENKGRVEQRFDDIRLTIRGIKEGATLEELRGHEPRLSFPYAIAQASLISERWGYYFVRPGVKQLFPLVVRIPASCTHILVRTSFRYRGTVELHTTERAFQMPNA